MNTTPVSLVIVSQERPEHLKLCLQSLYNQTHGNFEVIVVADALPDGFADTVKYVPYATANISVARNLGINAAAGDIIAYCDDDAIPDPAWLERLCAPFSDSDIGATSGFTRARNGISRQWGAIRFDLTGEDHPFDLHKTTEFAPNINMPVKLIGTNMAFRANALRDIGGFDQAYRFYLEDADVKLRLDQAGWKSAIVPSAEVHHSFAASARRTKARAPMDLTEIGASKAYFCAQHMSPPIEPAIEAFRQQQSKRENTNAMLLKTLEEGFLVGRKRIPERHIATAPPMYKKYPIKSGPHILLCARRRDKRWMQRTIHALHGNGCRVSVLLLSYSPRYFQAGFQGEHWLHRGGIFGKSTRAQPLITFNTFEGRCMKEASRISKIFPIDLLVFNKTGPFYPETTNLMPIKGHMVAIIR